MRARTVTLPKGKELLQQLTDQRVKYMAGQDALMVLILADKPAEARTYPSAELRPALAAYCAACQLFSYFIGLT